MEITKKIRGVVEKRMLGINSSGNQVAVFDDRCNGERGIKILRKYSPAYKKLDDAYILENMIGMYGAGSEVDDVLEDIAVM